MKSIHAIITVLLYVTKAAQGFGIHNLNNNISGNSSPHQQASTAAAAAVTTTTTSSTCSSSSSTHHNRATGTQRYYKQNPQDSNIILGMDLTINKNQNQKKQTHHKNTEPSLDVKSCWSKAGIGTCFVLEETQHKKFQVVFDLGW